MLQNKLFKRIYQKLTGRYYSISYSQTGEDIIIEFFLTAKKITRFSYLDIGANHPTRLSNTFKFYEQGFRGVCVEPDPAVFTILKAKRREDVCLNVGISNKEEKGVDFYVMENPLLNTFSKDEADFMVNSGQASIRQVMKIPLMRVSTLLDLYFPLDSPVLVNLDVEGIDELVIRDFPFSRCRPALFCIETVQLSNDASSGKRMDIIELMQQNRYRIFADTYVNTIFVDADQFPVK
jgi:FkbM family methyltransferase